MKKIIDKITYKIIHVDDKVINGITISVDILTAIIFILTLILRTNLMFALYWISIKKIKQLANPALDKKIKEMNYNQNLVNNNQINTSQTKKDSNNNLQVVNNKQLIKCKSCGIQYTGDYCPKCGTRRS